MTAEEVLKGRIRLWDRAARAAFAAGVAVSVAVPAAGCVHANLLILFALLTLLAVCLAAWIEAADRGLKAREELIRLLEARRGRGVVADQWEVM